MQLAVGLRARGLSQHVVSLSELDTLAAESRTAGIDVTKLNAPLTKKAVDLMQLARRLQPRVLQGWMYHGNFAATFCHYVCGGRHDRKLFWNLRASNMDETRYGRIIRIGGLLSRLPDIVIANSEVGAAFHRGCGFHAKRFLVIDNGIDSDKFRPDPVLRKQVRSEWGMAENAVLAIHVARVDPMKDHASLLAAMAQVPSVSAFLVGSGTEDLELPPNVRALGLQQDVARLLPAADIIVSTSAFGEGFSNAVAEGMSAGLIPIATDVGDSRRIVGDTGSIVPPRDPLAMARAIATTAALPSDERRRKGALARERISSRFSLALAVERYFKLYTEDVGSYQPRGSLSELRE